MSWRRLRAWQKFGKPKAFSPVHIPHQNPRAPTARYIRRNEELRGVGAIIPLAAHQELLLIIDKSHDGRRPRLSVLVSEKLDTPASRIHPRSLVNMHLSKLPSTPRGLYRVHFQPLLSRGRAFRQISSSRVSEDAQAAASSSVSQTEVSHFSRLASSWWDPHGPSRLLHLMNPLRHDFIRSCVQTSAETIDPKEKLSYLDVGCGGGIFATSAARLPTTASVIAIDPTPSVISVAKKHQRTDPGLAEPKLQYLQCSIEDLEKANSSQVDILTVFEVLEHVSSPSHFLDMCIPYVKPGGWLIGSTIARSPLSFLTTKVIAEAPLVGVVPPGTHDWSKYLNPDEIREFFSSRYQSSFGPVITQGVIYIPGLGWKMVNGSEAFGNYFLGVQKLPQI